MVAPSFSGKVNLRGTEGIPSIDAASLKLEALLAYDDMMVECAPRSEAIRRLVGMGLKVKSKS
jgi:hypothetical protein